MLGKSGNGTNSPLHYKRILLVYAFTADEMMSFRLIQKLEASKGTLHFTLIDRCDVKRANHTFTIRYEQTIAIDGKLFVPFAFDYICKYFTYARMSIESTLVVAYNMRYLLLPMHLGTEIACSI